LNLGQTRLSFSRTQDIHYLESEKIMPTINKPEDLKVTHQTDGWRETLVADRHTFNHAVMAARRWSFDPGASSPKFEHGEKEAFLYVISGSGTAFVDQESFILEDEAFLWLEPGDRYYLEAGSQGLEILSAVAPGI